MFPEITRNVAELCTSCGACSKMCEFLPAYCPDGPKQMAEDFLQGKYVARQDIPYLCTMCGLCQVVCKEKLNIGDMMYEVRCKIVSDDLPLPGYIKYVAGSQKFVTGDDFFLAKPAPSGSTKQLFFPGCGLAGYSPELVKRTREWINKNLSDCGLLLTCCGAPTYMSGYPDKAHAINKKIKAAIAGMGAKELIVVCPDCQEHFLEASDIRVTNLYEVMEPLWAKELTVEQSRWMMHDPCKSRSFPEMQTAARSLLAKAGYEIAEPKRTKKLTKCCGQGGLISYTDGKWAAQMQKKRADELTEDYVTYCGACRQTLRSQGKEGVHLLDILFTTDLKTAKSVPANGTADTKKAQQRTKQLLEG